MVDGLNQMHEPQQPKPLGIGTIGATGYRSVEHANLSRQFVVRK
jgi:hypothetical protein